MEKPEFLAALKLVSGEEILSVVTHVNDENGDYLVVEKSYRDRRSHTSRQQARCEGVALDEIFQGG